MPGKNEDTDKRVDVQLDLGAFETDARVIRDRFILRTAMASLDAARAKILEAAKAQREGEADLAQAIDRERGASVDLAASLAIVRRVNP